MAAAAEQEVDAILMEGFYQDVMNDLLGIKDKGLRSVVRMMLVYRDETRDLPAKSRKARKPADKLFVNLS